MSEENKGWAIPANSKKWHYFINGRALCGKWLLFTKELDNSYDNSPDNCAECKRRKAKLNVI